VNGGAILCDSNGCFSDLVLLSPAERFAAPPKATIRDRARDEGWTTDHHDRDICSMHLRGQ